MNLIRLVAQAIDDELRRQDYETPSEPLLEDLKIPYLDQGEVDLGKLAEVVIKVVRENSP